MAAVDPRVAEYARLLVERSLGVQPGWQVLIRSTPAARPLLEEVMRLIARKGAYPLLRMNWTLFPSDDVWAAEAPPSSSARWRRSTASPPTTWTRGSRSRRPTTPAAPRS